MARHRTSLVAAALALASLSIAACGKRADLSQGGTRLTFRAAAGSAPEKRDQALKLVADRMTRAHLAVLTSRAGDDLVVDVPISTDLDRVKNLGTNRGELIVRDEATPEGQIVIDRVAGARVERDAATKRGTLIVTLRSDDAARVGALSKKLVGKKMVVALDGAALSRPLVQTAIPGDRLHIALPAIRDLATADAEALALVALLEGGALPVTVSLALEEAITPQKR